MGLHHSLRELRVMINSKISAAASLCTSILEFWHKVEFFIPFDLQRQVLDANDAKWSVRMYSVPQLMSTAYTEALWLATPPVGRKLSGFEVYLGVFDKIELSDVTRLVVNESLTPEKKYDQERGELEGVDLFCPYQSERARRTVAR